MKKILALAIRGVLVLCLLATNPGKDDFVAWSRDRLAGGSRDGLAKVGASLAAPVVGAVTTVRNYGVCSLYETKLPGETRITLGILGCFVRIR